MDQFVCVRLVKANRLDLTLFQFDFDLTFAVLLMNADGTTYGRYGTRSERHDAEKDISLAGLAEALRRALDWHENYPANRAQLAGKQPRPTRFKTPDDYPSLKGKYGAALDYEGKVVRSCMHCHQVRDAERQVYRDAGQPIPDARLFPYPMPDVLGMHLDPEHAATVQRVDRGSPAGRAGVRAGDELVALGGQPLLSIADVQWVLHNGATGESLQALVQRGGEQRRTLDIALPAGWRRRTNVDWRVSTWPLRRMGAGGLQLEPLGDASRRQLELAEDRMALRVEHLGQYGAHGTAKRAGFRKGDVLIAFDGRTDLMTESALLAHAVQKTRPGQTVTVRILRDGRPRELKLPMQN